jgi:hypothetical protein
MTVTYSATYHFLTRYLSKEEYSIIHILYNIKSQFLILDKVVYFFNSKDIISCLTILSNKI